MSRRLTAEGVDLIRRMLEDMDAIGHNTVWLTDAKKELLVYFTFMPETAKRAISVLEDADCLGDNVAGTTPSIVFMREESCTRVTTGLKK